jgi:CheY-like chemotaxis protein
VNRPDQNTRKRILVFDDDRMTLEMASDLLMTDYEVDTTSSLLEFNRFLFNPTPPDAILIDVVMPVLDGPSVISVIKKDKALADIPVIIISSKPAPELEELAESYGIDGYLTKPLTRESLFEELARHL